MSDAREFRRAHPGGLLLGRDFRSARLIGLTAADRKGHVWIPGASGGGKSNLLAAVAMQDILQADGVRRGLTLIDWHGTLAHFLLSWIAENRLYRHQPIRIIEASHPEFAFSLNPFKNAKHFDRATLADSLTNAVAQVFGSGFILQSPRTYSLLWELFHALATLDLTLVDARDFITATDRRGVRARHLDRLEELDEDGADFWRGLDEISASRRHEFVEPLASRLRPFLRSPTVRRIFGQTARSLDVATAMDEGEVVIVNLKPGPLLSPLAARIIGTILVNEFYTGCFRRKNIGEKEIPHYLMIDECQLFLSPDIARILDESRKFGLYLTLAHQHLGHLREVGEHIFRSVITNTRVKCVFGGLDPDDAEFLARLMWRGRFNLQRPKAKLMRPQVVGHRVSWLAQEGESRGSAHAVGRNWTSGEATTNSESETSNWAHSVSQGSSVASVDMSSNSTGESSGEIYIPGEGFFAPAQLASSSSGAHSSSGESSGTVTTENASVSDTVGGSVTRGISRTRSSSIGGSETDTTSHSIQRGRSQTFEPVYELSWTDVWSLEEEVHKRSVSLANTRPGEMHVRVGNQAPHRVVTPFVTGSTTTEERIARVRLALLTATPYVVPVAVAQEEYEAHRRRLLLSPSNGDGRNGDEAEPEEHKGVEWR